MKAILVIDKPESCTSCLLGIYNKKWFCLKTLKGIDITDRYHIPDWCPLKPMPKKMEASWMETPNDCDYRMRWNDCINAIIGDTDGTKGERQQEKLNESNTCD